MTSNPKSIYLEYLKEIERKILAKIKITKKEELKLSKLYKNNVVYDANSCIQAIIQDAKIKVEELPPESVPYQRPVLNDIIDNIEICFSSLANNQSKNPAYDVARLFELAFDAGAWGLGFSQADKVFHGPFRITGGAGGKVSAATRSEIADTWQNPTKEFVKTLLKKGSTITTIEAQTIETMKWVKNKGFRTVKNTVPAYSTIKKLVVEVRGPKYISK